MPDSTKNTVTAWVPRVYGVSADSGSPVTSPNNNTQEWEITTAAAAARRTALKLFRPPSRTEPRHFDRCGGIKAVFELAIATSAWCIAAGGRALQAHLGC
jgi:hypothetical protein